MAIPTPVGRAVSMGFSLYSGSKKVKKKMVSEIILKPNGNYQF